MLHGAKPQPGTSLQTTLDPKVQRAAEKAISNAGDSSPAAIVALDVKSGDVLAVANGPSNGINRALAGQYQPGSTLKVSITIFGRSTPYELTFLEVEKVTFAEEE